MMTPHPLLASLADSSLPLPEFRQIELYSKKNRLRLAPASAPAEGALQALGGVELAFYLLDTHFRAADPQLAEAQGTWTRYLALPRRRVLEKIAAELYRILRICHIAVNHAQARREARDGLLRLSCDFGRCALALGITPAGLGLLCAAVYLYLDAPRQPHGEDWTEALLTQYFLDLVAEIRKFADEDRVLYQFRPRFPWFNRHCRRDCDNPRWREEAGRIHFDIGAPYRDPARYAIDFYLEWDDQLHIVPVEALQDDALPTDELPRWRVRALEGVPPACLPARFAMRFGREEVVSGQPMT